MWRYKDIIEHGSEELKAIAKYIIKGDFTKEITIKEESEDEELSNR